MNQRVKIKSYAIAFATISLAAACSKKAAFSQDTDNPPPTGNNITVNVTTIAGMANTPGTVTDGNGASARFLNPTKMVFDNRNKMLYVADGTCIRSIDQQNNVKTYLPLGVLSPYNEIKDIDIAPGENGGTLYFVSKENDLWKIEPNGNSYRTTKIIDRVWGGNETGPVNTADQLDLPNGVATGINGTIYFFNTAWNTMHSLSLQSLSPVTGTVTSFAGKPTATSNGAAWPYKDGNGEEATFGTGVTDIASDANGNIYVADFRNDLVRMVTASGTVTSLFQYENGVGVDYDGAVNVAQANRPTNVSASPDGKAIFFTTFGRGGNYSPALRMVRPGKDVVTLVHTSLNYGDGQNESAALSTVGGIAVTPDGKTIYVSEYLKKVIRKVTIQ
jgi:sugar lactone lactonase YvrE